MYSLEVGRMSACKYLVFALRVPLTVPRKVLKEKYQGEAEPDEILDDETETNEDGPTERIIEQPSIYSPSHSAGWDGSRSNAGSNNHIPQQQPKRRGRTSPRPAQIAATHQSPGVHEILWCQICPIKCVYA